MSFAKNWMIKGHLLPTEIKCGFRQQRFHLTRWSLFTQNVVEIQTELQQKRQCNAHKYFKLNLNVSCSLESFSRIIHFNLSVCFVIRKWIHTPRQSRAAIKRRASLLKNAVEFLTGPPIKDQGTTKVWHKKLS